MSAGIFAFLAALWIVAPAPCHFLWKVAVAASEWSLWLAALGLLGAGAGLRWARRGQPGKAVWLAVALGLGAVGLGLYPWASAWRVAQANDVVLSWRRYFLGLASAPRGPAPQTVIFSWVDGQALALDIYQPDTPDATARPAIIVIHGGGWESGDKSDFPQWDYWLTQQGYAVFDLQYRLAPQPNWQSATGDVKCAIGWVKRHAVEYRVDARRVALLGRSAGGHLALLAGYTAGEAGLPPGCPVEDTCVQAVIAFYAPVDLVWDYQNPANLRVLDGPELISRFVGGTPETNAEAYAGASPIAHVNPQTPATLLLQGGRDQLVRTENMERLGQRLKAAQVPYRTVLLPYAQHGFDYNFNGWGSQIAQPVIEDFLQTYLVKE